MDKIANGRTYPNAKFLRTTCKFCGNTLDHGQIVSDSKFCSRKHRKAFELRKVKKEIFYSPDLFSVPDEGY